MINKFIILCSLVLLSCSTLTSADFRCKQEGVVAPNWTCNPTYKGMYTGIGVSSKDDVILRSKEATLLAREEVIQKLIQKKLKLKPEFKADIKVLKSWISKTGTLYLMSGIPKNYFVKQSNIKTYKLSVKIPDNSTIETMCKNKKTKKIVSRNDTETLALEESKCYITVEKKGYKKYFKKVILDKDTVINVILIPLKSNVKVVLKENKTKEVKSKKQITQMFLLKIRARHNPKIEILNIKQKYHNIILLKKGEYKIKISKLGYKSFLETIDLNKDIILTVKLEKKNSQSSSRIMSKKIFKEASIKSIKPSLLRKHIGDSVCQRYETSFKIGTVKGHVEKVRDDKIRINVTDPGEGSLYSKGYYWDEYTNWKHCN